MTPLLDPKLLDGLTAETPELQGMLDDARNLSVAVAQPGTTPLDSLHLRTLPISTTLHPAAAAAWATGLAASKTLGPFTDRLGRPAWIDVFKSVRNLRFERTAGAAPFIALPVDVVDVLRKPIGKGAPAAQTSFAIPAGSVWIKSQLLAPAAPATGYTGLKIKFGVLTFSAPVTIGTTDDVVVPATVTATLDLTLDPPAPATGTGPGADARASAAAPPTEVRFAFDASGAHLDRADSARLLAYGCDVSLALTGAAPVYVAEFNQIAFPAEPSVPNFHVAAVASSTFMPSGTAPITEGAWTVPVATVDPAHLGAATGAGALALALGTGLKATWLGQARAAALQACVISVDTQNLLVAATQARGERLRLQPKIGSAGGEQFNLSWGRQFPLAFASEAVGIEALWTDVLLDATFSKPVDLNGWRLPLHSDAANLLLLTTSQGTTLVIETGLTGGSQKLTSFSLVNGILRASWPSALYFAAAFDGTTCKSGAVLLSYRFLGLLPTLPDPYASSAASWTGSDDGAITALYSVSRWTPTTSNFDFVVPATSVLPSSALTARGGIPGAPAATATGLSLPTTLNATPTAVTTAVVKNPLGDALQFEKNSGFVLLDVSTHIDQFGVAVSQVPSVRTKLSIQNMQLELEASGVLLVTLPAVQWEPVHTEQDPGPGPFPEKLSFANSGVPAWVSVPTVNLVPVFPEAAIGRLVDNFALPAPNPAEMRFTMPFGMLARAHLKAANISASETRGAKLGLNSADARHADRRLAASHRCGRSGAHAEPIARLAGFRCATHQRRAATAQRAGRYADHDLQHVSRLGEPSALVPVTRLDLSGYGESLFSNWTNPIVVSPSVERASFDVMIGRTAYEVVQVRTTLYPYAVTVVRTLTMERKNSATVVRRDSGWRAVGDGTYAFPPANAIATHPRVVRRITNVCNLRETGQIVTVDGIEIASVYFDGDLELDGVPTLVHVKDQVGFIQVTANVTLTPAIYAHALAVLGPLGGTVDANLKIGSGRIAMRLHRVDVAATQGMGGPEFVMASWGNLVFPGGGDWLFLRTDSPSSAPQAVAPTQGVPLIRAGVASAPPPRQFALPHCRSAGFGQPDQSGARLRAGACHGNPAHLLLASARGHDCHRPYRQHADPDDCRSLRVEHGRRAVPQSGQDHTLPVQRLGFRGGCRRPLQAGHSRQHLSRDSRAPYPETGRFGQGRRRLY